MGLTIAQLSARLRCAECAGELHSIKPWRLSDMLGKPLGRRGEAAKPEGYRRGGARSSRNNRAPSLLPSNFLARCPQLPPEVRVQPMSHHYLELKGSSYVAVLRHLHQALAPQLYLEIGTQRGASLALASCPSIAVDPHFALTGDFLGKKPSCFLYQMTSDDFFSSHSATNIFGREVDLVFLDGMHLFEFLLRDFMNVECQCRPTSVIAVHDCLPGDPYVARRRLDGLEGTLSAHPDWWTGDVWKALKALKTYRPDLNVKVTDARPTGLALITNLSPDNRVLPRKYQQIVEEMMPLDLGTYGVARLHEELEVISTQSIADDYFPLQSSDDRILTKTTAQTVAAARRSDQP